MNYLLIGNGPSATALPMGSAVDSFDGTVVRFNNYHIKGWESQVGTRTDVWATIDWFPEASAHAHKERWWLNLSNTTAHEKVRVAIGAQKLPADWRRPVHEAKCNVPTSGLALAAFLLSQGHRVTLYGFDFMSPLRAHHYGDKAQRGNDHSWWEEWKWFAPRLHDRRLNYLGWDRASQGAPLVRLPVQCGTDKNIAAGREPAQMGWYEWAARRCVGKTVLDVGAGTCAGLQMLNTVAERACGTETDPRLQGQHTRLMIISDLSEIHTGSFDVVVAMDVIEHVVHDLTFLGHLLRIAKEEVIVTTPNSHRSQCQNHAHCREYTIPQFANVFTPDELWTGSPDGHVHITRLLRAEGDHYHYDGEQGPDNAASDLHIPQIPIGKIPFDMRFNKTVDGEEWPHITAVFKRS